MSAILARRPAPLPGNAAAILRALRAAHPEALGVMTLKLVIWDARDRPPPSVTGEALANRVRQEVWRLSRALLDRGRPERVARSGCGRWVLSAADARSEAA